MKWVLWIVGGAVGLFALFIVVGLSLATPESDAKGDAQIAVESQLKDGGSAEFQKVEAFKHPDGRIWVCGEVNAKNSFGAMAGYRRFVYPEGGTALIDADTDGGEVVDAIWTNNCTIFPADADLSSNLSSGAEGAADASKL